MFVKNFLNSMISSVDRTETTPHVFYEIGSGDAGGNLGCIDYSSFILIEPDVMPVREYCSLLFVMAVLGM